MLINFNQLKLRDRIIWGYSIPILLSVGVATTVYWNVKIVEKQSELVEKAHLIVDDTKDLALSIAEIQRAARGYLIAKNDESVSVYKKAYQRFEELAQNLDKITEDRAQRDTLSRIIRLGREIDEFDRELLALVDQGQAKTAVEVWSTGKGRELASQIAQLIQQFEVREAEILKQRLQQAQGALQSLTVVVIVGTFLSAVLAIAMGLWVAARISQTINTTVTVISTSSTEIAATVEQQEQMAVQQATAVSQTTTTMDELENSAQQSVEQAGIAATVAQEVLGLAEGGNKNVDLTLAGMATMKGKVNAIAEQISRLSEQTQQIGSISGLVSDLANQTNMLALNAAVEAARAGENGKGFAVVAAEIRKLADQSKASADQINHLVTDIQKAIHSTVVVTGEGTQTVEDGMVLAQTTAQSFTSVASAIQNIVSSSQQISLTAQQQAIAIQQVVDVMAALNQGVAQTASGITQTKVGTQKLSEAALSLKATV